MIKRFLTSITWLWIATCTSLVFSADDWQGVKRVVAVGDIHGNYKGYLTVLTQAGIINDRGNWIAEQTHLVQVGDLADRGPDTDKVMEHLQKLERQARRDGGMVHVLIGNHEAMNILGDLRYVHPGEYEALKSRRTRQLRDDYYRRYVEQLKVEQPDYIVDEFFTERWQAQFPLGYVEHRLAWSPEGDIGKWVLQKNSVIRINRTLFLHAGISPEYLGMTISEINQAVINDLQTNSGDHVGIAESESGPLWYRGMAMNDEDSEVAHVDAVLAIYDVDRIVIGHTPGLGVIRPRFGGKVIMIDTGISEYYGGHLASLLIEDQRLFAIQHGETLELPVGNASLLPYFRAAAEPEPVTPALQDMIEELERQYRDAQL
jgi:hypothetical protein